MDGSVIGEDADSDPEPERKPEVTPSPAREPQGSGAGGSGAGGASAGGSGAGGQDGGGEIDRRDALKLRLAALCAVLAALFAAFAVWFSIESSGVPDSTKDNTALTDAQTSKAVQNQVSKDLNSIMSYDYKDPARTDKAAKDALGDNKLASDYSAIINILKKKGPSQKLAVQTKVVKSGVIQLQGDQAELLALASQVYTKGEGGQSQATSARLKVSAELDGNRWRITGLKQY